MLGAIENDLDWRDMSLTHERTLKKRDSNSSPIVIVSSVKTPDVYKYGSITLGKLLKTNQQEK